MIEGLGFRGLGLGFQVKTCSPVLNTWPENRTLHSKLSPLKPEPETLSPNLISQNELIKLF
jgi:hypothetical protein